MHVHISIHPQSHPFPLLTPTSSPQQDSQQIQQLTLQHTPTTSVLTLPTPSYPGLLT